jgi:cell fate (sporulation/competence/biofilm development) regulator YmcA (YheA/YmcA/DUF963 family)
VLKNHQKSPKIQKFRKKKKLVRQVCKLFSGRLSKKINQKKAQKVFKK